MASAGTAVSIRDLNVRYGNFTALKSLSLDVSEGEFVTLLGPSGCGKTTLLKCIGGINHASSGEIRIQDRVVNQVPIHKRNIGFVFQNYALFPHRTVAQNIDFGLTYRSMTKTQAAERVREVLEMVRLPNVGDRYPSELSGGQQQRIALARAVAVRPEVLLLDEPLSALDANLRDGMRLEIKQIQKDLGVTTIFVTHDQAEALSMSDRIAVMSEGRLEQYGTPADIYERPASLFVAQFIGRSNVWNGTVIETGPICDIQVSSDARLSIPRPIPVVKGSKIHLVARAHDVNITAPGEGIANGTVKAVSYLGNVISYVVKALGKDVEATMHAGIRLKEGDHVGINVEPGSWKVFDTNGLALRESLPEPRKVSSRP
ncbi:MULTISPECIES: ABC transporter ATP-binding protein [Rhizobium/Agrobacterium group]|uniref:ABC transporter ATP-binding protein n=1 Tax=Agrobacterium rosae TaxID=1972867 RepID=UPI0020346BEC|nr:ABC transporter ATP-binding protein [Agrobacterium rosae]MCM2436084.1 ABC transporter ATP-binding protein [Agrobacterium rosae]